MTSNTQTKTFLILWFPGIGPDKQEACRQLKQGLREGFSTWEERQAFYWRIARYTV